MAQRVMRYHKEYAPEGQEFDLETTSEAQLIEQGYTDSPAKLGINLWGPEGARAVAQMESAFRDGRVPAIDVPGQASLPQAAENERLMQENAELRQRLDEALRQPLSPQQEFAQHQEYENDMRSDAAKLQESGQRAADDPSKLDQHMTEQAQETQLEQQRQAEAKAKERADLAAQAGVPQGATTDL